MLRFGVNTERQGKPMTCQMQSAIPERLQGVRSEELVYGLVAASAGSGHEFCPCQDAIESSHLEGIGDVVELQEKLCSGSESGLMDGGKPMPRQTRPAVSGRLHRVGSQEPFCSLVSASAS